MSILNKLAFLIFIITIFGCDSSIHSPMDKAENLMQDKPKEALALLDSLKQYPLRSKSDNARFALLYSMALDKNYIDITDDSLISIAENWYSKKGNVREKFLAHYYKGVVNSNAKEYPKAITAFSCAQKLEKQINDNYLLGLLYNQMGHIYKYHYDYPKALDAYKKSYSFYSLANKMKHSSYTLLSIASIYWNMSDNTEDSIYTRSEQYYKKALEEGKKIGYDVLVQLASKELFIQYIQKKAYEKAEDILTEYQLLSKNQNAVFTAALGKYYYSKGNISKGEKLFKSAWELCKGVNDTSKLYEWEYHEFKSVGDYKTALESLERSVEIQNKAVRLNLQQPILEIQKQLLEKDLEYNAYKLKTDRQIVILVIMLLVVFICVILYLLKKKLKKKDEKLTDYLCLLAELQDTLQHLQNSLQVKDAQLCSAYADSADIIHNRLNLINNLSTVFYEKRGTPKEKEIFIKEIENIIEDFRTSKDDMKWMEQVINVSSNNLLKKVYISYPALTEEEKKLLRYIYAGFSSKSISIFLNIPIETVYNRKSRLLAKTGLSKAKK